MRIGRGEWIAMAAGFIAPWILFGIISLFPENPNQVSNFDVMYAPCGEYPGATICGGRGQPMHGRKEMK